MKTVVSVPEIAELEIKPRGEVAEWRQLVEMEIGRRWADRSGWITVACPCCGDAAARSAFAHASIAYVECVSCGSVYAPHRPDETEMAKWYRESTPARFWRDRLVKASSEARLDKIIRPRAQWVRDGISEYVPNAARVIDLSAAAGALLDELGAQSPELESIIAASPVADLDEATDKRVAFRPTRATDLPALGPADVIIGFDTLDRAPDLTALVANVRSALAPGGVFFATVPVASGFEMQALWDRSPTAFPPDKLNLPTIQGLLTMFGEPDWELLELSTPGVFDVEIVHRTVMANPNEPWPRVVRALLEKSDEFSRQSFTEYLQSQRLTSFARLAARRKS